MPRSSSPRPCSSRPPTAGAAARQSGRQRAGRAAVRPNAGRLCGLRRPDPGAHAEGDTGLERHRGESPVDKVLPGSGSATSGRGLPAYARQRGEAAVAGASDTLARVILVAAVVLGLVVLLAVLIRLAFRRGILRPLNEAGAHFDRIADGDLTGAIALRGDNEIGVLYSAMRRMQTGLTEAVASVRHGVEEIHTGSGEIAAGGADMSDRTARAGSLQEAAANMTQLAHTVQLTAGNADRPAARRARNWPSAAAGGRRSGAEHARHRRQRAAHRRDRGRGRQHRLPDQYPGAERGGRGSARRRAGQGLRRGRGRGAFAGAAAQAAKKSRA